MRERSNKWLTWGRHVAEKYTAVSNTEAAMHMTLPSHIYPKQILFSL